MGTHWNCPVKFLLWLSWCPDEVVSFQKPTETGKLNPWTYQGNYCLWRWKPQKIFFTLPHFNWCLKKKKLILPSCLSISELNRSLHDICSIAGLPLQKCSFLCSLSINNLVNRIIGKRTRFCYSYLQYVVSIGLLTQFGTTEHE